MPATQGSSTLAKINELCPLPGLNHLKRIRKQGSQLQIILDELYEREECVSWLAEMGISYEALVEVSVPAHAPQSKRQHARWSQVWPVSYHEPMSQKSIPQAMAKMRQILEPLEAKLRNLGEDEVLLLEAETGNLLHHATPDPSHPLGHACLMAINTLKREASQYLCMGLVAIKRSEPCLMCSMALLHSRIAAVCYLEADPLRGGLGGQLLLPQQPGINHRFPVYRINLSP